MTKEISPQNFVEAISAESYLADIRAFQTNFNLLLKSREFETLEKYIELFFHTNPLSRSLLLQVYVQAMNLEASEKLASIAARVFCEVTSKVLHIGRSQFGLPPIFEGHWMLGRIGELADQTAYTALSMKLNLLNQKPVMCLTENTKLANSAFIPYLKDHFEIVEKKHESDYFLKRSENAPFNSSLIGYNQEYGHNSNFFTASYNDLLNNNIQPYAFSLKSETIENSIPFLKSIGLSANDSFVLFHIREEGYYDSPQHEFRNLNVNNYIAAIKWLTKEGFKVIRIGHKKMMPMEEISGFIDLTNLDRPEEVDIYLCGRAYFYFGSGSGPLSLAANFGTPTLITASLPYGKTRANSFTQFLPLQNNTTNRRVGMAEVKTKGFQQLFSPDFFKKFNLSPIFPGSSENLLLVKEMLEYLTKGPIYRENSALNSAKANYNILGGLCSTSLSILKNETL